VFKIKLWIITGLPKVSAEGNTQNKKYENSSSKRVRPPRLIKPVAVRLQGNIWKFNSV